MGHGGHDLGARPVRVRPEQQVARAQTESRPVAERVPHRDPLADHRVRQGEAGQIVAHGRVPFHLALVDQHGHRRGGDVLGVRGDGEQAVFVHPRRLALFSHAIAPGQQRPAIGHHRHAQRRLVRPGGQTAPHIGVDLDGRIAPRVVRRGRRLGQGPRRYGDRPGGGEQGVTAAEAKRHGGLGLWTVGRRVTLGRHTRRAKHGSPSRGQPEQFSAMRRLSP